MPGTVTAAKKTRKEEPPIIQQANRVLALSMRPKELCQLVGQHEVVESISKQMSSGRVPHFFIISGPVGSGKTTLARIIGNEIGSASIQEINAANKTGVDDVRDLVEKMRYKPVYPARNKVIIMDEAHQLSNAAQNALLTEVEDVSDHVFYIFCTSALNKLIPGLRRRAFHINPEPLSNEEVHKLVEYAFEAVKGEDERNLSEDRSVEELVVALKEHGVTSPGLVLQATERYISGLSAANSVLFTNDSKVDPMALCRAVASGQWSKCCELLKDADKSDVPGLRNCVLGYIKAILLKSSGTKSLMLSKAIVHLSVDCIRADEGAIFPLFLASICMACDVLGSTGGAKTTSVATKKPSATSSTTAKPVTSTTSAAKSAVSKTPSS